MLEAAKIILSEDELDVIRDGSFFEKKHRITEKIYQQFANAVRTANDEKIFTGIDFPAGTDYTTGKITKGENYLGLPYILLDFPRNFKGEQRWAIRTMVWWGKFISSTLLISGASMDGVRESVVRQSNILSKKEAWICINESPWIHHFEKDNYQKIKKFSRNEMSSMMKVAGFVKIARKIPITRINQLQRFTVENFILYADILR
ncbi:MAG: hypothetical protein IPO83_15770 [Chitinophagaceae bacterium]|nr:hypothetical protein [Chitinophagaceae bacterium]